MPENEYTPPSMPSRPTWDQAFPSDLSHSEVTGEEEDIDIPGSGEIPDTYWEDGWNVDFTTATRTNFDWWKDHYYDAYPTRYILHNFHFSKSFRRTLTKNADLKTVIRPLRITLKKEELFRRHSLERFGEMPKEMLTKRYEYIAHHPSRLTELCVFHPTDGLIAFSIFELGEYSTYANMAVWSLDNKARGLGTFTLLKEVEYARSLGHRYYYMGHLYLANPAYRYKTRFPGLEIREHNTGIWHKYPSEQAMDLLTNERPRKHR